MTDRKDWPLALSIGAKEMNIEGFEALRKAGIHQVEFSAGMLLPFFSGLDFTHRAKELSDLAKRQGVEISSVHLPYYPFEELDPSINDNTIRRQLVDNQSKILSACADAGIKLAVIHPSGEPYIVEERSERLKCAIDTISLLCEKAVSYGVTLCIENLPRTCLCRTSDEMQAFLDNIQNLRVVFDTNHSLCEDNAHYIHAIGDKIASLHVSDYDFEDEKHWLPGHGKNDWETIISALEEVKYNGRFLYELHGNRDYHQIASNYRNLIGKRNYSRNGGKNGAGITN